LTGLRRSQRFRDVLRRVTEISATRDRTDLAPERLKVSDGFTQSPLELSGIERTGTAGISGFPSYGTPVTEAA
jgi:hypothetical protein